MRLYLLLVMPFHLPRRHRRKLLFPPGLLALAGLLWLGCVAVGNWSEQLKPKYAIRLTMPLRPQIRTFPATVRWEVPNPDTLLHLGSWHEATLTGSDKRDVVQQQHIIEHLRTIVADTLHNGGLRVRLEPTSHYANLIFLLDLMLQQNVKKYWLDITRQPTTFYVITNAYKPPKPASSALLFDCLLCNDIICSTPIAPPPAPFDKRFDNWMAEFWHLTWLLIVITILSGWRIIRAWHTACLI